LRGPQEKSIDWTRDNHVLLNELNYTMEMILSATDEVKEVLNRFKIIKINDKNWEV
jgi:hypothetical protein